MTIYYETLHNGLIPVQFIGWSKTPMHDVTGAYNAVIRLKRSAGAYEKGETLHVPSWVVVQKAGRRNYRQWVKPAELPAIDKDKLIDCRW